MRCPLGFGPLGARSDAPTRYQKQIRRADHDRHPYAGRSFRSQPDQAYAARPAHSSRGGVIMSKICKVTINDEPFLANCGELLLDWALMNGVDLPHDCRSGICGACKVRLVD